MSSPTHFYRNQQKVLRLLGLALGMTALCGFLLNIAADFAPGVDVFVRGVGVVGLLFFGLGVVIIARQLADTQPVLLLDQTGITDRSSANSFGQIPWSEVAAVAEFLVQDQRFVGVQLRDPDTFLQKQPAIKRWLAQANSGLGAPIALSAATLNCSHEELLAAVQAAQKQYASSF